jgi:hypothetical protein
MGTFLHRIQTGCGAHPALYPVDTGSSFAAVKRSGHRDNFTVILCSIIQKHATESSFSGRGSFIRSVFVIVFVFSLWLLSDILNS